MTDLVITETKNSVRAHRATCKRANDATPIARTDPQIVAEALPASCCKPNKSEVAAAAVAAREVAEHREIVAQKIEDEDEARYSDELGRLLTDPRDRIPKVTVAASGPDSHHTLVDIILGTVEEDPTEEDLATIVFFSEAKVSKHYWTAFGREGAEMIGEAFGVKTTLDNSGQHVIFTGDYATNAREALLDLWVQGFSGLKVWRKTDESYRALPSQDTHWVTSERYAAEQTWLRSFTADRAESFGVL